MNKNELLLNIYKMNGEQGMGIDQGCLVMKCKGRKPCKILKMLELLRFAGEMKHLSVAIDTGAEQECEFKLLNRDGLERLLTCKFLQEVVALEVLILKRLKFSWEGTAKEFKAAVDRMIARMPGFFAF